MKKGILFCITSLLLLTLSVVALFGQMVTIDGIVADKASGEKLLGANIKLKSNSLVGGITDLEGHFSIQIEKSLSGDSLVVSYVGYRKQSIWFVPDQNKSFKINLLGDYSILEDVVITAKQPIAEDFVLQKLDYLKIVSNPSSYADPLLAVRTSVSSTNTDESASPSLRGSAPDQTRLFLNEVPIYDYVRSPLLSGIGVFSVFTAKLIKSQLVFPGNPPVEYGNAGAGLIHITTPEKFKNKFIDATVGLANVGVITGLPLKKGVFNLWSNYQSIDLFKRVNPNAFNNLNYSEYKDAGINLFHQINGNSILKFYGYGIDEKYSYTYQSPSFNGNYTYSRKMTFYVLNFQKNYAKSTLSINNGTSYSVANSHVGNYIPEQTNQSIYGSINYQYFFSDFVSSKAGATYDYRSIETNGQFPIKSFALSDTSRSYNASIPIHRDINEIYLYTKYSKYPFTMGAGVRKNIPVQNQSNYWTYQVSLRYEIGKSEFINLAVGRYHNYSSPSPAYYPFLLYQTDQVVLDYSLSKKKYMITSAIYLKSEKGLYDVKTTGFELYVSRQLTKKITADIAFSTISASSSITDTNLVSSFTYNPSLYNMRYNIKSNVSWNLKWLFVNFLIQARPGSPYTPVIGSDYDSYAGFYEPIYPTELYKSNLPDYFRADISFTKIVSSKRNTGNLIIFLTLSNMLSNSNVRSYYYNFDYSQANEQYFQKRFIYFGLTKTFTK